MITTICAFVACIVGCIAGTCLERRRSKALIREVALMTYRECNKKWLSRNAEEIKKRVARRKGKIEN